MASTPALLPNLASTGGQTRGLFIDYGQAACDHEWRSVQAISSQLSIRANQVECSGRCFGAGEVIGRNLFFVSAAIFLGQIHRGFIAIGVHDGTPHYDCSQSFVERVAAIMEEQSGGSLSLIAPCADWQKPQIFSYFQNAGLDIEATSSCETGAFPPCGSCASCRDRRMLGCRKEDAAFIVMGRSLSGHHSFYRPSPEKEFQKPRGSFKVPCNEPVSINLRDAVY